jgi:hypothetical protein
MTPYLSGVNYHVCYVQWQVGVVLPEAFKPT